MTDFYYQTQVHIEDRKKWWQQKDQHFPIHEPLSVTDGIDIFFAVSYDTSSFIPRHWHDAVELIYITKGELEASVQGMTHTLHAGDILLVNSKIIHATRCSDYNEAILIQLPYPFLNHYIPDFNTLHFNIDCSDDNPFVQTKLAQVRKILEAMALLQEHNPDGDKLKFHSLLFDLLYQLYHNFRITAPSGEISGSEKLFSRLNPVLAYTQEHYASPISIHEIAKIALYQPEYFCRFFKKNMGITYLEYLNEIRLSHIYRDLISTDLPVSELLEKHGFTNYKLFRRLFHEQFHATPSEIRHLQKKQN